METDWAIVADQQVTALRSALMSGEHGLDVIPKLIKSLLQDDLWKRRFVTQLNEEISFTDFREFVEAPAPKGLGTSVNTLRKFCHSAEDMEAFDLLVRATPGKQGRRSDLGYIVTEVDKPHGNMVARSLITLKNRRPDLHAQVIERKITARAAMIEAGFRELTHTIPHNPRRAAEAILRHFTREEAAEIARVLHWSTRDKDD